MTAWETTLLSALIGAGVGSAFSVIGMVINSWLTQRRERRQQVWQTEVNRITALEERAGRVVEIACGHRTLDEIRERIASDIPILEDDAGRFLRHKVIARAIRDLHNGVSRLLDDKAHHRDCQEITREVDQLYVKLLDACEAVTGRRQV